MTASKSSFVGQLGLHHFCFPENYRFSGRFATALIFSLVAEFGALRYSSRCGCTDGLTLSGDVNFRARVLVVSGVQRMELSAAPVKYGRSEGNSHAKNSLDRR